MNAIFLSVVTFFGGIALGMIFFGGLWFTVRKVAQNELSAAWIMVSFAVRTAVTLSGFYFIAGANWQALMVSLFGFIIARSVVKCLTKLKTWEVNLSIKKANEIKS